MNPPFSLDIETAGDGISYALEPWRYKQSAGRITSIAVCNPDDQVKQVTDDYLPFVKELHGQTVWMHNGIFDVAWMLNYVPKYIMNTIKWRDTMLGMKWLLNGQKAERKRFSYTLDNCVGTFLKDHPLIGEFHAIKQMEVKPGASHILENGRDYWDYRGELDAIMTLALGRFITGIMPERMVTGFEIECDNLVPIAESWLRGIRLDREKNEILKVRVTAAKTKIAKSIGQSEAMFTSPKQLAHYLYNELGMPIIARTPKGAPSTAKDTLMQLYYNSNKDPNMKAVMDFKNIATMESKFLKGIDKCSEHNKENYSHAAPRLFGTITGRMTYSNKSLRKYFIGLAQHQIPREGPIKSLLMGDEDELVVHFDAAAQELRFIGQIAPEQNIIDGFNNGVDLHADMAASIAGQAYDTLVANFHNKENKKAYTEAFNYRQAGKLTNLSCQYRIGAKALQGKFFSTYQIIVDWRTAKYYLDMYVRQYPGVPIYWDNIIAFAKTHGYVESIANRRFKINEWGRNSWASESNAINGPIQGSGADHTELAVKTMNESNLDVRLLTIMHDGILFSIKDPAIVYEMDEVLNSIDYQEIWQKEMRLKLPFDGEVGLNFGALKEFTYVNPKAA